ncbi:MAG: hypothetical protein HKN13_13885 [Rhodothermales bacterium]|nr:hypothetical protein [Rhodothermales bacterium]
MGQKAKARVEIDLGEEIIFLYGSNIRQQGAYVHFNALVGKTEHVKFLAPPTGMKAIEFNAVYFTDDGEQLNVRTKSRLLSYAAYITAGDMTILDSPVLELVDYVEEHKDPLGSQNDKSDP